MGVHLKSGFLSDQYKNTSETNTIATAVGQQDLRSFRQRSVRLRLELIRLRLIWQFAYILKHVFQQLIHLLYVRLRSDASQSNQFPERDS